MVEYILYFFGLGMCLSWIGFVVVFVVSNGLVRYFFGGSVKQKETQTTKKAHGIFVDTIIIKH